MQIDIKFLGDAALERKLDRLDKALQGRIARKAMREAARPVLARARQLCPVKTGRLRDSLKIKAADKQARFGVGVHVVTGRRDQLGIPQTAKYYYPAAVEYGHGAVAAHSFLRRGLDETRALAKTLAASEIWSGIRREASK